MEDRRTPISHSLNTVISGRLPSERLSEGLIVWSWWYAASLAGVILAPSFLVFGEQLWDFPKLIAQSLGAGLIYAGLALLIRMFAVQSRPPLLMAVAGVASVTLIGLSVLLDRWGIPSGRAFLAGMMLSVVFAVVPLILGKELRVKLTLVVTAGVALLAALPSAHPELVLPEVPEFESTLYYPITMALHTDVVPPIEATGGAITRFEDGYVLVTGIGEFYRIRWEPDSDILTAERLPLSPASFNRQELIDAEGADPATYFRITDVIIDDRSDPARLYISHHHWNADRRSPLRDHACVRYQRGVAGRRRWPAVRLGRHL